VTSSGPERAVTFESISAVAIDSTWSIASIEDVGAVVGTRDNLILQRSSQRWIERPTTELRPRADVILDLGGRRFLSGGEDGTYAEWGPGDLDVCPPFVAHAAESVAYISRLEDGFLAVALIGGAYNLVIALPDR